jgi:hypothetical protein
LFAGEHIGAFLRVAPAAGDHDRHLIEPKLAGGHDAAMPGNDAVVLVNQDRHRERVYCFWLVSYFST